MKYKERNVIKKILCTILAVSVTAVSFTGCINKEQKDGEGYNAGYEMGYEAGYQTALSESESSDRYDVNFSGEFAVTVRYVSLDYCVDDIPSYALVTFFQCPPELMYVGKEIGPSLKEDKMYTVSFEPFTVKNVTEEEAERISKIGAVEAINTYRPEGLKFGDAKEEYSGLNTGTYKAEIVKRSEG